MSHEDLHTSTDQSTDSPALDLSKPLPTYDWADLTSRHEAQLARLHARETELMQEFDQWTNVCLFEHPFFSLNHVGFAGHDSLKIL